jgi:hypothetical protein
MDGNMRKTILVGLGLLMMISLTILASASSGGDYVLDWFTIDGGGGTGTGGDYAISGTIGQPDVGSMSGGDYSLEGGFWERVSLFFYALFLPIIMR